MKLVVAGSRGITDKRYVWGHLYRYKSIWSIDEIICGGAKGVDQLAILWAKDEKLKTKICYPKYSKFPLNPRVAPLKRNEDMAILGDRLIAIWDGKSSGTAHMIECMKQHNKPVAVVVNDSETRYNWVD